jgi:hypothetical protein
VVRGLGFAGRDSLHQIEGQRDPAGPAAVITTSECPVLTSPVIFVRLPAFDRVQDKYGHVPRSMSSPELVVRRVL